MANELRERHSHFSQEVGQERNNQWIENVVCRDEQQTLGSTAISLTLEREAVDSQAHLQQVIWRLLAVDSPAQWTPGWPRTAVFVCPGWGGEKGRRFWHVVKEALSHPMSLAFGVKYKVQPWFFFN